MLIIYPAYLFNKCWDEATSLVLIADITKPNASTRKQDSEWAALLITDANSATVGKKDPCCQHQDWIKFGRPRLAFRVIFTFNYSGLILSVIA